MKPDRDHIHAQFGTRRDLLAEHGFMDLIEAAEAFAGAPFTLCHCSEMGKDTINLTGTVRHRLRDGRWVPDSGFVELGALAPAHGRWFSVDTRLPLDPGYLAEVHFRLERSYVEPEQIQQTIAFIKKMATWLDIEFGYVHGDQDELLQDTFDPKVYRSLTGEEPALVPIDPRNNPGRSVRVGQLLLTCRWLSLFGGELARAIGYDRLLAAPCRVETLDEGRFLLQLFDDPYDQAISQNRAVQTAVRDHLGLDDLAASFQWAPLERRAFTEPSATKEPTAVVPEPFHVDPQPVDPPQPMDAPFFAWASLLDGSFTSPPSEEQFYADEARRGAGHVLQIGCLAGRITIPVAKTGVPVLGVDPDPSNIEEARARLRTEPPAVQNRVTLLATDICQLDLSSHGPFAAVFMPHRAINRFTDLEELRRLLENLHGNLVDPGVLALSTFFPRPRWLPQGSSPSPELVLSGEIPGYAGHFMVFDTIETDPVNQLMTVHRRVLMVDPGGEVQSQRFRVVRLRYFYPQELRYLFELAGFEITVHGGFNRAALERSDQEVVAVAHRI